MIEPLEKKDIKELLLSKSTRFGEEIDSIVDFIFEKTRGNNLSVVFAVEEALTASSLDELITVLDHRHMSSDIENYYSYLWNHILGFLETFNLRVSFPDVISLSSEMKNTGAVGERITEIMPLWGKISAQLNEPNYVISEEYTGEEKKALFAYNDAHFSFYFSSGRHKESYNSLKSGPVTLECVIGFLDDIFTQNLTDNYVDTILKIHKNTSNVITLLLTSMLLLISSENHTASLRIEDIINIDAIEYIGDDNSFTVMLYAFKIRIIYFTYTVRIPC